MANNRYDLTVRRAALPEVLLAADIGLALGIPEAEAEHHLAEGALGPVFFVGGRPAILRDSFLKHLAGAASTQTGREVLP